MAIPEEEIIKAVEDHIKGEKDVCLISGQTTLLLRKFDEIIIHSSEDEIKEKENEPTFQLEENETEENTEETSVEENTDVNPSSQDQESATLIYTSPFIELINKKYYSKTIVAMDSISIIIVDDK
jgi:hypothetical protein